MVCVVHYWWAVVLLDVATLESTFLADPGRKIGWRGGRASAAKPPEGHALDSVSRSLLFRVLPVGSTALCNVKPAPGVGLFHRQSS